MMLACSLMANWLSLLAMACISYAGSWAIVSRRGAGIIVVCILEPEVSVRLNSTVLSWLLVTYASKVPWLRIFWPIKTGVMAPIPFKASKS